MSKKKKNKNKIKTQYEILDSIRKDWGAVKPYVRVFLDERERDNEKIARKEIDEYEY